MIGNISGMKYGRLTALRELEERIDRKIAWLCVCECGNQVTASASRLQRGLVKSCGCLAREVTAARLTTHGAVGTKEYRAWSGMVDRCTNPNYERYDRYGGRGITVDPQWEDSFENFYRDMGPAPSQATSIDRKDNDGNYTPDNCRWASRETQMFNRGTPKHNSSGVTGVSENADGTWGARLQFQNKTVLNQRFDSFDEAVKARQTAEREVRQKIEENP